jgi:hypothetical protein
MGELAYVRMKGQLARQWRQEYPAHFWKLVAVRFYMFWAGVPHTSNKSAVAEAFREGAYCLWSVTGVLGLLLALRRKLPAAGLFGWAVVLFPIIYYFVVVGSRFRHPIEPILLVLSIYLFQQAQGGWGFTLPGLRQLWPASARAKRG